MTKLAPRDRVAVSLFGVKEAEGVKGILALLTVMGLLFISRWMGALLKIVTPSDCAPFAKKTLCLKAIFSGVRGRARGLPMALPATSGGRHARPCLPDSFAHNSERSGKKNQSLATVRVS
jgi:hypothetical protein